MMQILSFLPLTTFKNWIRFYHAAPKAVNTGRKLVALLAVFSYNIYAITDDWSDTILMQTVLQTIHTPNKA